MIRIKYLCRVLALVAVLLALLLLIFPPAPVKATADMSIIPLSENVAIETTRTAKTEPDSGPVGTEVRVSGAGFRIGEDGITITYDGEILKCNIAADHMGSWETIVEVPPSTKGRHRIGIYGSSFTPKGIVPDSYFDVIPQIHFIPKMYFEPGSKKTTTELTVIGMGFAEDESVSISFDSFKIAEAVVDSLGSFSATFEVPERKSKEYAIDVAGSSGSSAQAIYFIQKTPPPAPQLSSPVNGARLEILSSPVDVILGPARYLAGVFNYLMGSTAKSLKPGLATFVWTEAAESSTARYVLQIARTYDFSSLDIVKTGLGSPSYTLSGDDVLTPGAYNWRVKAVDDAGDESEWSAAWTFELIYISDRVLTNYVVGLLLLIGAAVIGLLILQVNKPKKLGK